MTKQQFDIGVTLLGDGREVAIRPAVASDYTALLAFSRALPLHDYEYMPDDFQNCELIGRLTTLSPAAHWRQLIACSEDAIVGYAAVRRLSGCSSHVGEIQLNVSGGWRCAGLGSLLARAILDAARELEVTQVIVEMPEEQAAGRAIFERLGFSIEGLLEGQVRDRHGQHHNLLVMARQIDRYAAMGCDKSHGGMISHMLDSPQVSP
ncbi:MAG TPA: GNAT family N-acetyltransferase [Roseiflexaceae bacterium]|nr:GNAT family N-acetyltransferase [Roseiflexaceae bacterium]